MTREEVISELLSIARQSEDAALANDAGVACHRDEYEKLFESRDAAKDERIKELYTYIITWPHEAKRLRKEAAVFREAAGFLLQP